MSCIARPRKQSSAPGRHAAAVHDALEGVAGAMASHRIDWDAAWDGACRRGWRFELDFNPALSSVTQQQEARPQSTDWSVSSALLCLAVLRRDLHASRCDQTLARRTQRTLLPRSASPGDDGRVSSATSVQRGAMQVRPPLDASTSRCPASQRFRGTPSSQGPSRQRAHSRR